MKKISIIIPVYNCEKYLKQCLDSALVQTIDGLEVICVDDGSTDRSAEIIRRYQARDRRIVLFQQENQGAGAARNLGIQKSKGKYVAFLDADDLYPDASVLEAMYHACEVWNLAACAGRRKHIWKGVMEDEPLFQEMIAPVPCGVLLDYQNYQIDYDYQNFIFLREHLTGNGIYFPDYRRFQDPPFLVRALYAAGRFMVIDACLYCYRLPDMEQRFDGRKTCDLLRGLTDNLLFAREHHLEVLFRNTVWRINDEYADVICRNITPDNLELLGLLMRANQIISEHYRDGSYVIQPFRTMAFCMNQYPVRESLLRMAEDQKKILLYGAGQYGRLFFHFLKKNGLHNRVAAFVVSDVKGNEDQVEGVPVVALHERLKDDGGMLLVAVRNRFVREVEETLIQGGYKNYRIIKEEFLHALAVEKNMPDPKKAIKWILAEQEGHYDT